jgi:hypothetical protein
MTRGRSRSEQQGDENENPLNQRRKS